MGLDQGLLRAMNYKDTKSGAFNKGEDEEKYKAKAREGSDLMFPVTIGDKTHRPDINVKYHTTIRLFDRQKDNHEKVHEAARKLNLVPPNPREALIEPTTLKGRDGNTMHVLRLHGPHADNIREHHNNNFQNLGETIPNFHPHITVDEPTWHAVKNSGAKTALEAGIEFHPAELRHGDRVIAKYPQKVDKSEDMEKGIKHIAAALGVAGALAATPKQNIGSQAVQSSAAPSISMESGTRKPANVPKKPKAPQYNHAKMLNTIAQIESSDGKMMNHKATSRGTAYGKYGLMPDTIKDTIHMHPDLRAKYGKASALQGEDLNNYMQDNPELEDIVADRHLQRLEHHFGQDPNKVGFAWNQGIRGTYNANPKKIQTHPYTKKINSFYSKVK
jgi:hypothetical protein